MQGKMWTVQTVDWQTAQGNVINFMEYMQSTKGRNHPSGYNMTTTPFGGKYQCLNTFH